MGAVAAVAIGAVALNGRTPATDPTTVGGTGTPTADPLTVSPTPGTDPIPVGGAMNCGDGAPETLLPEVGGVSLGVELPNTWREGDVFVLPGQVDASGGAAELTGHAVIVALLADGTVQASGGAVLNLATGDGRLPVGTPFVAELILEPCGNERLPAGEYTAVASMLYEVDDGRSGILQVGGPITVTEWTADPAAEAAAEAAVAEILAATQRGVSGPPGTCGTTITPGAFADDSLRVGLSMTYRPERPRPQSFYGHAFMDNIGSHTVATRPRPEGTAIVLTRDGVVVAIGTRVTPWIDSGPLTAEPGSGWGLTTAESFAVCALPGSNAPDVPLPAGDYQGWAVLTAGLTDLDGPVAGTTREVTVVSEPVDVTYR